MIGNARFRFVRVLAAGIVSIVGQPSYAAQDQPKRAEHEACLFESDAEAAEGAAGAPYDKMPMISPIGVRTGKYITPQPEAFGPTIPAGKGYRLQDLGDGLFMITDNIYQSLFLVYDGGVVVIDAPPNYAKRIQQAIAEVTKKPVTHIVYSHAHADHIGGAGVFDTDPEIIAHEDVRRMLERAADPNRPAPTQTFTDSYELRLGAQVLELSYHGNAHTPGNIFIYAPRQRVLMVVDVVFPGWMPWRRFALAEDIPGYFEQVELIRSLDWDTFVGGHVARTGVRADVDLQAEFNADVKRAAAAALASVKVGESVNPQDAGNPWALFDNYIDRVAAECVSALAPEWAKRLAAFDVYIWDQCYAMEQSLRID